MNAFNFDYVGNVWNFHLKKPYPEWVRIERLYNCENFSQFFGNRKPLIRRLLDRKATRI